MNVERAALLAPQGPLDQLDFLGHLELKESAVSQVSVVVRVTKDGLAILVSADVKECRVKVVKQDPMVCLELQEYGVKQEIVVIWEMQAQTATQGLMVPGDNAVLLERMDDQEAEDPLDLPDLLDHLEMSVEACGEDITDSVVTIQMLVVQLLRN